MSIPYIRHKVLTGSGLVETGPGNLYGFMVNSHTGGTLKIWDSLSGAGDVIFDTITFPAGSGLNYSFDLGANYSTGLFATIGGTASITFLYGGLDR